jgi:hypothetical protein
MKKDGVYNVKLFSERTMKTKCDGSIMIQPNPKKVLFQSILKYKKTKKFITIHIF